MFIYRSLVFIIYLIVTVLVALSQSISIPRDSAAALTRTKVLLLYIFGSVSIVCFSLFIKYSLLLIVINTVLLLFVILTCLDSFIHKYKISHLENEYIFKSTYQEISNNIYIEKLEKVLSWANQYSDKYLALEIKFYSLKEKDLEEVFIKKLCNIIKKYKYYDNSYIFGKNHNIIKKISKNDPKINLGIIVDDSPINSSELLKETGASLYCSSLADLEYSTIKNLKESGYFISSSIVNDKRDQELVRKLEIDAYDIDIY